MFISCEIHFLFLVSFQDMIKVLTSFNHRLIQHSPKVKVHEFKEGIISHFLETNSLIIKFKKTFSPLLCTRYMSTMSSGEDTASKKRKLETENGLKENGEPVAKKATSEDFQQKIKESRTSVCGSVAEFKFNKKRVRVLSKTQDFPDDSNGVVYWMSRDQRVQGKCI